MSINVDARGLTCPQPVIATKKALDSVAEGVVTSIVDNAVAKENVVKFAVANSCGVSVEEKSGHYYIKITKGAGRTASEEGVRTACAGQDVYLITKATLGHGSEELGAVLMKAFIYTVLESSPLPRAMLFLNSGVQLTANDSPVLEHLKSLASRDVQILSCGTCLDYFNLKDRVAVGGVSNMYNIIAELSGAAKVITL
jgi:selenium metabolism protein YedF